MRVRWRGAARGRQTPRSSGPRLGPEGIQAHLEAGASHLCPRHQLLAAPPTQPADHLPPTMAVLLSLGLDKRLPTEGGRTEVWCGGEAGPCGGLALAQRMGREGWGR